MLECQIEEWVIQHPRLIGFDRIEKIPEQYGRYHKSTYGDCIGYRGSDSLRIEIESTTSGFFLHHQEVRDQIPILICAEICEPRDIRQREELKTKEVIDLWKYQAFRDFADQYEKECLKV